MTRLTSTFTATAALLLGLSTVSAAQKGQSKGPPPAASHSQKAEHQAKATAAKETAKEEKSDAKDEKGSKAEGKAETAEVKNASEQSAHLLKGVKLTSAERKQVEAINKKYEKDLQALRKDEKAGTITAADFDAKVSALATSERTDIRAIVPTAEQAKFDANAAALSTKKP